MQDKSIPEKQNRKERERLEQNEKELQDIRPMTPAEVVDEIWPVTKTFCGVPSDNIGEKFREHIRSSLRALLLHVMEQQHIAIHSTTTYPKQFGKQDFTDGIAQGRLQAIDDCKRVIERIAKELE